MAETQYIVAHDMGTSSNKAILTTVHGKIIAEAKAHYPMYHPVPHYAEQDPFDWWNAVCETTRQVLEQAKISPTLVAGITFSSQTQCFIPVDETGTPVRRAFSWLDGRSANIIHQKLWTPPRIMGYNIIKLLKLLTITGGSPGHTGKDQIGKILWMKTHEPDLFARTHKFIDAKDYLIHRLTGNMVTSADIAHIWWMLDTRKNRNTWHPDLCKYAGISPDKLLEVKPSAAIVGHITKQAALEIGLPEGVPVVNGAGDLSAAALGSGALKEGEFIVNIGTCGWVGSHETKRRLDIVHYAGCIGSTNPDKYYLALAHQQTAGVCLEWLKDRILYHKDQLQQESHVRTIYILLDQLAASVPPGSEGLIFTPWMYGERCPLDDDTVRAGLYNVSLNHSREHIVRAVLEGIAFNLRWAMETLEKLCRPVEEMRFIGGGAQSDLWCQIMADVTNKTIHRVEDPGYAGAKGVALLTSMTLGFIPDYETISSYIQIDRTFKPNPETRALYDRLFKEFKNLYKQNRAWFARMNR